MTILTHLLVFVIGTVAGVVLASLLEASHRKGEPFVDIDTERMRRKIELLDPLFKEFADKRKEEIKKQYLDKLENERNKKLADAIVFGGSDKP